MSAALRRIGTENTVCIFQFSADDVENSVDNVENAAWHGDYSVLLILWMRIACEWTLHSVMEQGGGLTIKKEIFHASAVENLLGMDNELIEWLHWKDPFHTVEVVTSRNVGVRPSPRRR